MAIGNEAVTLKQFKVWAAKNSGGGSSIDVLLDKTGDEVVIPASDVRKYSFFIAEFTLVYDRDRYPGTLFGFQNDAESIVPKPKMGSYAAKLTVASNGDLVINLVIGSSKVSMDKLYGIKEL